MSAIGLTTQFLIVAMLILRTFRRHESIQTNENKLFEIYDYIVVGSGSAGAIVAHRLAQDGQTTVLLLEAGGPSTLANDIPSAASYGQLFYSSFDWNYTMEQQFIGTAFRKGRIPEARGFGIGGSSSINTMIFNRGNRRDYDIWEQEYGAIGWSYRDVLPFFKRWEGNRDPFIVNSNQGYHGIDGPIGITSFANPDPLMLIHQKIINSELGIPTTDLNGPQQLGTRISQAFIDSNGIRSSASNSYIDPNPFPHNLHILTNAYVTKILINGRTAVGVSYLRRRHSFKVFANKEVIICAGTINSPQLLMLSGIGPAEHLQEFHIPVIKDLPVGYNLQNHPGNNFYFPIRNTSTNLVNTPGALTIQQLYQFLTRGIGPLKDHYRSITYFNTPNNREKEWPNANFETAIYRFPQKLSDLRQYRYQRPNEWKQYFSNLFGRLYLFAHPILQRVRSRGYIRLASADPNVYPIINPKMLTHPQDLEDAIDMIRMTLQFYELSSISQFLEPLKPIPGCSLCPDKRYAHECQSYIRCHIEMETTGQAHPIGTCRMGNVERNNVVVDPNLRVKGLKRLRVCDASVMPLLINSNTNSASLMIGEKCAQLIKDQPIDDYHN